MGLFDPYDVCASLDAKGGPLVEIDVVPWKDFLLDRMWALCKPDETRKLRIGRERMNQVLMFKAFALGALYNSSDDQIEYQMRDWLFCIFFLNFYLEDQLADAKLVGLYREALTRAGDVEALFALLDGCLALRDRFMPDGRTLDASLNMHDVIQCGWRGFSAAIRPAWLRVKAGDAGALPLSGSLTLIKICARDARR